MRTLFVIHLFEGKEWKDSAGYHEIMKPMLSSGYITEYEILFFGQSLQQAQIRLTQQLEKLLIELGNSPVLIYGAGEHSKKYYSELKKLNIVAFVDRDKTLCRSQFFGYPVISPDKLTEYDIPVIVSSRAWEDSIVDELSQNHPHLSKIYGLYKIKELDKQYRDKMLFSIQDTILNFKPELLVYTPTHPNESLKKDEVERLKKKSSFKMITVWWDYDENSLSNSYIDFERESLQYSDLILDAGNYSKTEKIRKKIKPYSNYSDIDKIKVGPSLCNPDLFFYQENSEKLYDIAIFGSAVGHRKKWIKLLKGKYSSKFHHIGGIYSKKPPLSMVEYAQAISKTKIFINTQTYPFRSQCKGKVREALSCGIFLLEEDNNDTRMFIPDDQGVVYFSTIDELYKKIDFFLENSLIREKNASKSHQWFTKYYNSKTWFSNNFGVLLE